jgi:hypothetical protein
MSDLFNGFVDTERRDIPDLEPGANYGKKAFQVDLQVMVGLKTGLVDQEFAALPQGPVGIVEDLFFQLAIEHEEGNATDDIVSLGFLAGTKSLEDILGAVIEEHHSRILDGAFEDPIKIPVTLDQNKPGIGFHILEQVVRENPGPGSIFNNQITAVKVDVPANPLYSEGRSGSNGSNILIPDKILHVGECINHSCSWRQIFLKVPMMPAGIVALQLTP